MAQRPSDNDSRRGRGAGEPGRFGIAVRAATLIVVAAGGLVFFEWLFQVTKPSFLTAVGATEHGRILAVAPWPFAIAALLPSLLAAMICAFLPRRVFAGATVLGAAALTALLALLLADNFLYTLFRFGVFDLAGAGRLLGLIALGTLFGFAVVRLSGRVYRTGIPPATGWIAASLALAGLVAVLARSAPESPTTLSAAPATPVVRPNIVIFSADGLDVRRMSAFGYSRPTTPFLARILDRGLVFENAFTNSSTTTGSIGALLTGRLPTTTRVNFRPDLFRDEDSYRHLPGLLRTLGYHSADISVRYYADAADLNLRRAFHWANGRSLETWAPVEVPTDLLKRWNFEIYFISQLGGRILERLLHLAGIQEYVPPYREVTHDTRKRYDSERLTQLAEFLEKATEPFFINTHFMVAHGSEFPVYHRRFSAGQEQDRQWMVDFYDDAVLDVDTYLNFLFDYLTESGQLARTLIVVTSDHGERSRSDGTEQRLPLIFFFPGDTPAGRRAMNAQRIDIAPTLLDYLGLSVPDWMEGTSLLGPPPSPLRPIVATRTPAGEQRGEFFEIPHVKPPLYTLAGVSLVQCQRWWGLDLISGRWTGVTVDGHTRPCEENSLFDAAAAKKYLIDHLLERGYPPSALETAAGTEPPVRLGAVQRN